MNTTYLTVFKMGRRKTQMNADFSTNRRKKVFISVFSVHLRPKKGKCQVVRMKMNSYAILFVLIMITVVVRECFLLGLYELP